MSNISLLRAFGHISCKSLKSPNFVASKRLYALKFGGNGNGSHNSNPDCKKLECDPKIQPLDKQLPNKGTELKRDQVGTYRSCPPPAKKVVVSCNDLPAEPQPPRRKRKPFVPASACKKPPVSISVSPCDKAKEEKCKRVQIPNCGTARIPPTCLPLDQRPDCKREEYKFPAFSACYELEKKHRFEECECREKARGCN